MCRAIRSRWPLGANEVAAAIAAEAQRRGIEIELVRNGSRGMFWLEPLVEVATPAGRVGLWPGRRRKTLPALFDAGLARRRRAHASDTG